MFGLVRDRLPRGAFVGVVSRLDAPVSGVLVFAKTRSAAAALAAQFRDRTVDKEYVAVVEGRFPAAVGAWVEWHDLVERHPEDESRRGGDAAPRAALLKARVVRRAGEVSLVELVPSTGRRHQLRLQLSGRRCPIVGDRRYGARLPFPEGIALHARSLTIAHPRTAEACTFEAPPPAAWRQRFPGLLHGGQAEPGPRSSGKLGDTVRRAEPRRPPPA